MPRMHDRIRDDLEQKERALWSAMTSASPAYAVRKLCSPDATLMFPEKEILHMEGEEEDFEEALKPPFHRFDTYELEDIKTMIVDLMAGSIAYKVSASRGKKKYTATGSSTWGQGADGEWRLICHSETLV